MAREIEAWFTLSDGLKLFEETWEPASSPNAHLIFLHGFNDRSEIQYNLFPTLSSNPYNITIHAIDQRGWGKSVHNQSQRGLTGPTPKTLADINEYIHHVRSKIPHIDRTPLFIMGHSMGGQILLHYLLSTSTTLNLTARAALAGAILEAPYIALDPSSQPYRLTVLIGKLLARISPSAQMKQSLDERFITRDPGVNRAWKEDPLCHEFGTLEGLRDMLARGAELDDLGKSMGQGKGVGTGVAGKGLNRVLPMPVFWAHGTEDRITAFGPSRGLFDALQRSDVGGFDGKSKSVFRAYQGAYHKIHAEPDGVGIGFARDVGDWILRIVRENGESVTSVPADQSSNSSGSESESENAQQRSLVDDPPEPLPVRRGPGQGGEVTDLDDNEEGKLKSKL